MVAANAIAATAKTCVERRGSNGMRGSITPNSAACSTGKKRKAGPRSPAFAIRFALV
jgi:hypothetical protein